MEYFAIGLISVLALLLVTRIVRQWLHATGISRFVGLAIGLLAVLMFLVGSLGALASVDSSFALAERTPRLLPPVLAGVEPLVSGLVAVAGFVGYGIAPPKEARFADPTS